MAKSEAEWNGKAEISQNSWQLLKQAKLQSDLIQIKKSVCLIALDSQHLHLSAAVPPQGFFLLLQKYAGSLKVNLQYSPCFLIPLMHDHPSFMAIFFCDGLVLFN